MVTLSDARLLRALTLRPRVAIRRELAALAREHDAEAAFLWLATSQGGQEAVVETAGEQGALPVGKALQGPYTAACELRVMSCQDREERDVVVLFRRLCQGAPLLVLGLVDNRLSLTDVLTENMEAALERIETVLVDVVEPLPGLVGPRPSER